MSHKTSDYEIIEIDNFPCWALSYLINGDSSGLELGESQKVDSWCENQVKFNTNPEKVLSHFHWDVESDITDSFTRNPAFGLACNCTQINLVIFYKDGNK